MIESFYILAICAVSCGIIGTFVFLRNLSMITDAISHSVLLGIVLAFFLTHDIDSSALIVGASLFGVLTVFCIEALGKTGYVKKEDAVGIVFPIFFALAVILISRYARNVHIDTELILMGEVILAPLHRMDFLGMSLPVSLVINSVMLLINVAFVIIFYKELKLSTFDTEYTIIAGFSATLLFYLLMTLVSMTAVTAFKAVGSILVISFFITPGLTAYLLTKDLRKMLVLTAFFGVFNSAIGYFLAVNWNLSMAGMCATVSLITFILVTVFHEDGIITKLLKSRRKKIEQRQDVVIIHIGHHQNTDVAAEELGTESMHKHLNWDREQFDKIIKSLNDEKYINIDQANKIIKLSDKGIEKYQQCCKDYGIIL